MFPILWLDNDHKVWAVLRWDNLTHNLKSRDLRQVNPVKLSLRNNQISLLSQTKQANLRLLVLSNSCRLHRPHSGLPQTQVLMRKLGQPNSQVPTSNSNVVFVNLRGMENNAIQGQRNPKGFM